MTLKSLKEGGKYKLFSRQFNCSNPVTFIGGDYTGLRRDIGYFCFHERTKKAPTLTEFAKSMGENKLIPHTFAIWGFELNQNYSIHQ